MSKEIMQQYGGKIELALLGNGSVMATLVGGSRPMQGNGMTTEAALSSLLKESLVVVEEAQSRVWALSVIQSPNNLPACIVLYTLDTGAELYFTRDSANGDLVTPEMSENDVNAALDAMQQHMNDGDVIITYGGLNRDLKCLAERANRPKLSKVAMQIYDIPFQQFSMRGFSLPFTTACNGMHVEYTFNSDQIGTAWGVNPTAAVNAATDYCQALIMLWENIVYLGKVLEWTAKSGKPAKVEFGRMMNVQDALALPEPDTSWMEKPPAPRYDQLKWMRLE